MRDRRLEYVLDRKEQELRDLRDEILQMIAEQKQAEVTVIIAEIILFLIGMAIGALLMKTLGM